METINPTSNIPSTGFTATNTESIQDRRLVCFNESANFTFNSFALLQLIHGRLLLDADYGMSVDTKLMAKLALYSIESTDEMVRPCIELNRKEVQSLRLWLEARMKHCEKERDQRVPLGAMLASAGKVARGESSSQEESEKITEEHQKFNPDTYIAQKFLLLDIREWLLGDIKD